MARVKVGKEEYGWGPEVEALPDATNSIGDRLLSGPEAHEVILKLEDADVDVLRAPKLTDVYVIQNGERRAVRVGCGGVLSVPLQVWERPPEFKRAKSKSGDKSGDDITPSAATKAAMEEEPYSEKKDKKK